MKIDFVNTIRPSNRYVTQVYFDDELWAQFESDTQAELAVLAMKSAGRIEVGTIGRYESALDYSRSLKRPA